MNSSAKDILPEATIERHKLAHGVGFANGEVLLDKCREYAEENRRRFEKLLGGKVE